MTGGGVPYSAEAVITAGYNECAIPVEVNGRDRVRVGGESLQTPARLHIPKPHSLVERSGDDQIRLRVEIDTKYEIRVPLESLHAIRCLDIPYSQRLVV